MFDHDLVLFSLNQMYAHRLVADIADEHFVAQPAPGVNHPAWILGHLSIAADYGLELCQQAYACPAAWHDLFGPGTEPLADRTLYPTKAELLAAYDAGHAALAQAVLTVTPAQLEKPNELGFLPELPTYGHLLKHLLSSHEGWHLGQLSAWRRIGGMPRA
ncbi:MAG: DinB family protein [Gemmataceae bacterium]